MEDKTRRQILDAFDALNQIYFDHDVVLNDKESKLLKIAVDALLDLLAKE